VRKDSAVSHASQPGRFVPDSERQAEVEAVLKTLVDARLVTTAQDTAEVAHEALIREWPALQAWLEENRDDLRAHHHLTEAAQGWERLDRDPGELYRGARLTQALEWVERQEPALNPLERQYLTASREAVKHRETERELAQTRKLASTQQQRAIVLALGLIAAVILSLVAFSLYRTAVSERSVAQAASTLAFENASTAQAASTLAFENASTAQAASTKAVAQEATAVAEQDLTQAGQLAAIALNRIDSDLDLALLLSVEGIRKSDNGFTRDSLLSSLQHNPNMLRYLHGHIDRVTSVAFSPEGELLASERADSTIRLWDPYTGEYIGPPLISGHNGEVTSLAFNPDGALLASGGCAERMDTGFCSMGEIRLWDAHTGEQIVAPLSGHTRSVLSVAFSPDGELMASATDEGVIRLHDTDIASWIDRACQRAGRNLTTLEWQTFFPNEAYRETCPHWSEPGEDLTG
jgi:hypothetical protein